MSKSFLDDIDTSNVFKAFWVSSARMIAENPKLLVLFNQISGMADYLEIYNQLKEPERDEIFLKNINEAANNYDWGNIEETYRIWGKYGWITDQLIVPLEFCEYRPLSQINADSTASRALKREEIEKIKIKIEEKTGNISVYRESIRCFDNKCYTACASLLISLIDGELIRCQSSLAQGNKKTGAVAGTRMVNDVARTDMYGLPGYFHLSLINYHEYISTLFASGCGFTNEPKHMNRNYLHHGMSKRKVLKRDCIKLLIAYNKTLSLIRALNDI